MKINKKIKGISLSEKYNIPADELEKLVYGIHGDIYDCRDVMRAVRLYQSQLPSPNSVKPVEDSLRHLSKLLRRSSVPLRRFSASLFLLTKDLEAETRQKM